MPTRKNDGAELFTIEQSHGKPRVTGPRPSDLGTVPTGRDRSRNHGADGRFQPGNDAARDRGAKRALTAPLRAARTRLREAVEGQDPDEADALLGAAMAVYASARAELGSNSTFVAAPCVTFATESVLAGYFTTLAAKAGFCTEQGAAYLKLAHDCETHAQRAMTSALAAAKALGGKRRQKTLSLVERIARAGDEEDA